ncbi:MAG: RDD family protein [Steroidobacteraceae bacterium]
MKTNILKLVRWWTLVLCCVLLSAARAQDVETPAAGKDATVQAPGGAGGEAERGARAPAHKADDERRAEEALKAPGAHKADDARQDDQAREANDAHKADGAEKGDEATDDEQSDDSARRESEASRTTSSSDGDDEWAGSNRHRYHHRHNDADGDAVVSIGHKAELLAGQHAESVVAIFGSAVSAGDVDNAVVSVFGAAHVTGKVGDAVVAVLGSVYVNSEVDGDVVSILGKVELGPEARVRGNVVIVGGDLTRDPSATIDGHVQTIVSTDWEGFDWLRPWVNRCLLYGRPLAFTSGIGWAWGIALGLLALYVFTAFLFRGAVEHCVKVFEAKPSHSILAALLTMLLTPVLFVLLFITVLGIAAVPFLAFGLLCAAAFGKVVMLAFIGRRCTPMLADDPVKHTVVGVAVGGAIVLVLYTIPFIGFIVYKLLGILGLGVVVYALLIAMRSGRIARAAARNGGGGPNAGGVGPNGGGPGGGVGPQAGVGPGGGAGPAGGGAQAAGFSGTATGGTAEGAAAGSTGTATGGTAEDAAAGAASGGRPEFGDFNARSDPPLGGFTSSSSSSSPNSPGGGFSSSAASGPTMSSATIAALPRAGFGIRIGALLLDIVLIGIVLHQFHESTRLELIVLATYGAVMWKLKGSTIGGIICGLQVVRLDGRPIDWPTAIVRALSCFLSLAVVGLGFLWIAIDSERQSWHDKIAGTAVVRAPKGASLL